MTDTAQLREALDALLSPYADGDSEPYWLAPSDFDTVIAAARELLTIREAGARELLTIREAGALIITPDKKTVGRIAEVIYQQVELYGVTYDRVAQEVLDALRDAMPDGET